MTLDSAATAPPLALIRSGAGGEGEGRELFCCRKPFSSARALRPLWRDLIMRVWGEVKCRDRLGELLRYYYRDAA